MKLRLFYSCRALFAFIFLLLFAATGCNQSNLNLNGQTISFGQIPSQTLGAAPLKLTATASSGLAVSFASGTPAICTVSGTTASGFSVTLIATGTCTVVATQAGGSAPAATAVNGIFEAAAPVTQSFTVSAAIAQTITFTDSLPATATYSAGLTYTISAKGGGSGNPVTFTVSGPATLNGGTLTITGTGTVTVTANQAGNATYAAASAVKQSIVVSAVANPCQLFFRSCPPRSASAIRHKPSP